MRFDFTGTLAGADQVASGAAEAGHDAVWFSSNRYLALRPEAQAKLGPSAGSCCADSVNRAATRRNRLRPAALRPGPT